MPFSSSSASSSHKTVKSKAEGYAEMAKELKKDMLSNFICTKCNTKGRILQVIDHTLPMGGLQAGDSWALKMVKMNTRHELHPFGEVPGPPGSETGPELRRLLQLSLGENSELQEKYNSALAIIEKMQSNHKIELQQERYDLSATLKQRETQIQDKERMLGLFREKVRYLSIKCDTQACCKPEHITLMEQKKEVSELLCLEKDRYEALHAKHASLDSIYQDTQGLFEEEKKRNVGLVSSHDKLAKEHQRFHLDHEEL